MREQGASAVYDVIDHITTFNQYQAIEQDHQTSLDSAEVVLATSDQIFGTIKERRNDCLLVPNAVQYDDFQADSTQGWPEMDLFKERAEVIIGYYGAIAEWIDFDIIQYCASLRKHWTFLLVGETYPGVRIPRLENIVVWERQDYKKIPYLLQNMDVAIIPFKINDITINTSPVKVFEYMAGGKPVVSTELPEVKKYLSTPTLF